MYKVAFHIEFDNVWVTPAMIEEVNQAESNRFDTIIQAERFARLYVALSRIVNTYDILEVIK